MLLTVPPSQINVTRHPYSFVGDADQTLGPGRLRSGTWHTGLMDYTDGTEQGALHAERGLQMVAAEAGIKFDFGVKTDWQPVNSQRMLLWAGKYGKQEEFMTVRSTIRLAHQPSDTVSKPLIQLRICSVPC